jgi:hypothetical protein
MTAPRKPAASAMLCVYNTAGRCSGFIIARGKTGHEAFTADEHPIGIFPSMKLAAAAVRAFSGAAP